MTPRQRRDAARNRERLVEAARAVFARRGLDATLDDVAKAAGVGVATAYRHFGDKHELAAVVLAESHAALLADLDSALAESDPWAGLRAFCVAAAERQAQDLGLQQALSATGRAAAKAPAWTALGDRLVALVERASVAGVLRPGVTAADVPIVLGMLGPVYDYGARAGRPDLWRRYLDLLLAGLAAPVEAGGRRDEATRPFSETRALTRDDIDTMVLGRETR